MITVSLIREGHIIRFTIYDSCHGNTRVSEIVRIRGEKVQIFELNITIGELV
jgi:hypothetical protein